MISGHEPFRLFLDPTIARCTCKCRYCYVKAGRERLLLKAERRQIRQRLEGHPGFVPGPAGTLLAFGSTCDLLRTDELAEAFLDALARISPLGNPMQISTKHHLRPEWAESIRGSLIRAGQMTVFVSCATVVEAATFEPGAAEPAERFRSFSALRRAAIPSCLFIKPYLPGVTERSLEQFRGVLSGDRPDALCLGAWYRDARMTRRVGQRVMENLTDIPSRSGRHPLFQEVLSIVEPPEAVYGGFRRAFPDLPIFRSSPCVVAHWAGSACPLHPDGSCG